MKAEVKCTVEEYEALNKCIVEKWEYFACIDGKEPIMANGICALCLLDSERGDSEREDNDFEYTDCEECIIKCDTDEPGCVNTPYWKWDKLKSSLLSYNGVETIKAANNMLDYLNDLKSRCTITNTED